MQGHCDDLVGRMRMMPHAVRPSPLVFVVLFFALGNIGAAVAHAYSATVPAAFLLLYYLGVSWGFSSWVLTDSRERKLATSIDHGWFVFSTWPFFVPYHALRTRGWRGGTSGSVGRIRCMTRQCV